MIQICYFLNNIFKKSPTPGLAPNRILQKNVCTAVGNSLHNSDIKALNIGFTEIALFHDEKIYTARNSREKKLKLKLLNHVQSDCGKGNVILTQKKYVVAELEMYIGD